MSSLGIYLGSARVVAALVDTYGVTEVVADRQDAARRSTGASVYIGEDGCLAGDVAEELVDADARLSAIVDPKSQLGRREPVFTDPSGRLWGVEGVTAILLRKVLRDAQAQAGAEPGMVGIAAPLWFNDVQRRALRDAAKIAGLANPQLVDEPLAVAAFHRSTIGSPCRTTLLVDLGHAGVAMSVLRTTPQGDAIAGTSLEPGLGLQSLETEALEMVSAQFTAQTGVAPPEDPAARREFARISVAIVESLAASGVAPVRRVAAVAGRTVELISFPHQWAHVFERRRALLGDTLQRCLDAAGVSLAQIQLITVYGEAAGFAPMQDALKEFANPLGIEIAAMQPADAVACGTALLVQESGGRSSAAGAALPTCSNDLGITVFDRKRNEFVVDVLIQRGTALPASAKKTVYTNRADQKRMVIQVAQVGGADGVAVDLGVFEFGPIASPRKNYPVEITLSYDAEGIVMASALDPEAGTTMEQVISAEGDERAKWTMQHRAWVAGLGIND